MMNSKPTYICTASAFATRLRFLLKTILQRTGLFLFLDRQCRTISWKEPPVIGSFYSRSTEDNGPSCWQTAKI